MTLTSFIQINRADLNTYIAHKLTRNEFVAKHITPTQADCRQWILNDESLYQWARSSGVRI